MRPPWLIIGRTAKPSIRRRPVNSALGLAFNMARSLKQVNAVSQVPAIVRFGQANEHQYSPVLRAPGVGRTGCANKSGTGAPRRPTFSSSSTISRSVVVGASRRRAAPRSQSHGRAALGASGSLGLCRAGGAGSHRTCASNPIAPASLGRIGSEGAGSSVRCVPPARPNRSFKGTRNSKAARPRCAQAYHAPHGRAALLPRAP